MFRLHDICGQYEDIVLTNSWASRTPTFPQPAGVVSAARSKSHATTPRSSVSPLVDTSQLNVPPNTVVLGRSVTLPPNCRLYHTAISRLQLKVEVTSSRTNKAVLATALGRNPVFVNGILLPQGTSRTLRAGDIIEFLECRNETGLPLADESGREEEGKSSPEPTKRLIPPLPEFTPLGRRKRPRSNDLEDDRRSDSSRGSADIVGRASARARPPSPWAMQQHLLHIQLPVFTVLRRSQSPETSTTAAVRRECSESIQMPRGVSAQMIQQIEALDETPRLASARKKRRSDRSAK